MIACINESRRNNNKNILLNIEEGSRLKSAITFEHKDWFFDDIRLYPCISINYVNNIICGSFMSQDALYNIELITDTSAELYIYKIGNGHKKIKATTFNTIHTFPEITRANPISWVYESDWGYYFESTAKIISYKATAIKYEN